MIGAFVRNERFLFPGKQTANILDCGSRDGMQAIDLSVAYPDACVYAFECNPATLQECRLNTADHDRVTVIERAINLIDGTCEFYPIDQANAVTMVPDGNPGASSLFRVNPDYPYESLTQVSTEVRCQRLDSFCDEFKIDQIDLIWLDLQGAELTALKSLGPRIRDVRMLHTEVEFKAMYLSQPLFDDVDRFLRSNGFFRLTSLEPDVWFMDIDYVNFAKLSFSGRVKALMFRVVHLLGRIYRRRFRNHHPYPALAKVAEAP